MNVPKIRFPEFRDDYVVVKFGDVVSYQKGFAFKSKDYTNEGIRIIRITDTTKDSIKENDGIYINENNAKQYTNYILKENDIIISSVGSRPPLYDSMVGKVILVPKHANNTLLNQNAIRFRSDLHNQIYIYNYLKQNSYTKYIESIMRGNANQRSITLEDLFEFNMNIPFNINEENKVSVFLSLLDKKIELQSKKIEDLKLFKSYTKNQLFNNGEKIVKLKDILFKWNEKNKDNSINYVESISNKYGFISQADQFEDRNVASKDLKNYYVIRKNVFGYNPSRLNVGSLALKENDITSVVSPLYECFTTTQNNKFMLEWFDSKYFKKETLSKFEGGVRNTLNFTNLCEIEINLPSLERQNIYARYLYNFDKKINLEESKLNKLNEMKKGLMQNMFV